MEHATDIPPIDPIEYRLWLDGIVSLQDGAKLRSVSVDTLKRLRDKGKLKFIRVSERRLGVRRRDVLMM